MVLDSLQNYVNLVSGASKATRARASAAARGLLSQAGLEDAATEAQEKISRLADDILNASRANRELLENVVGAEVEKAAVRLGFARAEQVEDLQAQIAELRVLVEGLAATSAPTEAQPPPAKKTATRAARRAAPPGVSTPAASTPTASTPTASTPTASTPTASTPTASTPTASTPTARAGDASVARKQTTKKSPASKAAAKKSPAAKAAARTAPAVAAARRVSPAERAAKKTVAPPSPVDSAGDVS